MSTASNNLWNVVWGKCRIDPAALMDALDAAAGDSTPDFRTRLLMRDSLNALAAHWTPRRLLNWLGASPARRHLMQTWQAQLGPPGFHSLEQRLMEPTRSQTVYAFLRDLGTHLREPTRIEIGGAIALILAGVVSRSTEDIDVVDPIPASIRKDPEFLDSLARRYGLRLSHFQSHFLPARWEGRLRSIDVFENLQVFLVDEYDVFVGKLFIAREKDLDDLREMSAKLDMEIISGRLRYSASALLANDKLRENALRNWYVLQGQPLPV